MQLTKFTTMQITMNQEHKNTITQNKLKQLNPSIFGRLLRLPAWKPSGSILKEKVRKEVDK